MRTAKVKNGNIYFTTEVEVDACIDVDVKVNLSDAIDDIIDSLDESQADEIAKKAGINKSVELHGDELRRHLCDLLQMGYHTQKEDIIIELNGRI